MGDLFYNTVCTIVRPVLRATSRPLIIDLHLVPRTGPVILAATHQSPFDVPVLMRHSKRPLDFVSVTEVFRNPLVAWFYGNMNAFPLDRWRPDAPTVRTILSRLKAGRAVAMFPEGAIRSGVDSVVHTRRIRKGIGRLALLSRAPVVPCVIINSDAYARVAGWLPFRQTRYGIIYGNPLDPSEDPDKLEEAFLGEIVRLHAVLSERLNAGRGTQQT